MRPYLSGDLKGDDQPDFTNRTDNAYHVVCVTDAKGDITLDGVTIRDGHADAEIVFGFQFNRVGSGVFVEGEDTVVRNCLIADNYAVSGGAIYARYSQLVLLGSTFTGNYAGNGGGLKVSGGDGVSVIDCVFQNNEAVATAGAIGLRPSIPLISGCLFISNHAGVQGGAIDSRLEGSKPMIADCVFLENSANQLGGAINNFQETEPIYTDCLFVANSAAEGGAAYADQSHMEFINCMFSDNSAINGGAVFDYLINHWETRAYVNCLFEGNTADQYGGAFFILSDGEPHLANCTITGNAAGDGGAMHTGWGAPTLSNCILWGNTATSGAPEISGGAEVNYSLVQGGWAESGGHVIDADPLFVDPDSGDYRLLPGSPCVDAADNTAVPEGIETDLDDVARFTDNPIVEDTGSGDPPVVDMGAYEFRLGDLDHDGMVDVLDLLSLLAQWGPCNPETPCTADLDHNWEVDVLDLLLILGAWD